MTRRSGHDVVEMQTNDFVCAENALAQSAPRRTRLEELMIMEEPEEDEAARVYLQISKAREQLAAENARRNIVRWMGPQAKKLTAFDKPPAQWHAHLAVLLHERHTCRHCAVSSPAKGLWWLSLAAVMH